MVARAGGGEDGQLSFNEDRVSAWEEEEPSGDGRW